VSVQAVLRRGVALIERARIRRSIYAVLALLLLVLCFVPRPWVARAKLLPQESSSAGLGQIISSLGGQLSNFANLLTGGRSPNDLYLIIGRSNTVTEDVIRNLHLVGPGQRYSTAHAARIDLARKVDVHLLIGGVVEVETRTHDPQVSLELTQAYLTAISDRIGALTRQTTKRKGEIVAQRFRDAQARVLETERNLDAFRRANRLASPEAQLGSAIALRTSLQAQLSARQVELQSAQQTAGPENPQPRAIRAQIAELQAQIARTARPSMNAAGPNMGGLSQLQSRYLDLFRDYRFAQALYDVYARASEQVAVEELVADSATFIQVIEPANLDAERHFNIWAVGLLSLVVIAAIFTEVYVPATGLRWPGRRRTPHQP